MDSETQIVYRLGRAVAAAIRLADSPEVRQVAEAAWKDLEENVFGSDWMMGGGWEETYRAALQQAKLEDSHAPRS